ncbi:hypothetical protein Leryth_022737, partial [Lithospermum erythrorhizon]
MNICIISVDYNTKPLDIIFRRCQGSLSRWTGYNETEISQRCFFTKAISIWTSTGDADHVMIVGSYFHYAGGFEPPQ